MIEESGSVFTGNARGWAFYERLGWRPTGVRTHSKFAPNPDLLRYELDLGSQPADQCPMATDDVVAAATAKEPERRLPSVAVLERAWPTALPRTWAVAISGCAPDDSTRTEAHS